MSELLSTFTTTTLFNKVLVHVRVMSMNLKLHVNICSNMVAKALQVVFRALQLLGCSGWLLTSSKELSPVLALRYYYVNQCSFGTRWQVKHLPTI